MNFFTIEGIILLVWGISLLRFILRWMNGRKSSGEPSGEISEEEEYTISEPPLPQRRTYSLEEDSDNEYNYKELRERVLRSWGMTDKKLAEMDLPDEMEKTVYKEMDISMESARSGSTGTGGNRFQAYLSKQNHKEKAKKKTQPMVVETVSVPHAPAVVESTSWSESTVRTWMKYDVVFGEPRGRNPWTPSVRS